VRRFSYPGPRLLTKNSSLPCRLLFSGIFKLKMHQKILGQKIGDLNGSLDSTGTGIISLSETFSKITFEKPII
jgi:hypothetical protein